MVRLPNSVMINIKELNGKIYERKEMIHMNIHKEPPPVCLRL